MRRRSRLQRKLQSIMDTTKVTGRGSESSEESDSDSSATTIPSWSGTWFNRTHYRLTRTRPSGTTHSILTSSSSRPRSTTHVFGITSKGYFSNTSLAQATDKSSMTFPVGLLAVLASLAGIILVLLVFLTYFGYIRKRRWRNPSMAVVSQPVITVEEGITNQGYEEITVVKVKANDRLSIIPECVEEQEHEYVDPDKLGMNKHWHLLTRQQRYHEYEYDDPDNSPSANTNSNAAITEQSDEYEYVDPDKSSNHKLSSLPKIVVSPEDFEYVDPDRAAGSTDDDSTYQDMVPLGLDPHLYADSGSISSSSSDIDGSEHELPPQYDDINTDSPPQESLAVDSQAYHQD